MLYTVTLFAHSWVRWALVLAAMFTLAISLVALRRGTDWRPGHARLVTTLDHLAGVQLVLGLVLALWASPIVSAAWKGGWAAMRAEPVLLFFGVIHPIGMAMSFGLLRAGTARVARRTLAADKHRLVTRTVGAWLLVVTMLVPWPGLPWGRPAARVSTSAAVTPPATPLVVDAPAAYRARCASCHGEGGDGDGIAATSLTSRPRAFRNPAWQRATTDERIRAVIIDGGASVGLSPLMPAHPDLSATELDELVRFIRAGAP
ncbi:MAG: cytochrome c [Kofleriaceae bacterium]|nr:cytochrome c [Kofleriaceae bacterium]